MKIRQVMKKLTIIIFTVFFLPLAFCLLSIRGSYAAVPHLINYQGDLRDEFNRSLDGAYNITFRIYDTQVSGAPLWQEVHTGVVVQEGIFSVILGSMTALDLSFDRPYFLELKVGDEVMVPRESMVSVGYAMRAKKAERAVSAETVERAELALTTTDLAYQIPKGSMFLCRSSCPAGYKRVGQLDGKFLAAGTSYNPSVGGSNNKTLTVDNLPAHNHDISHGHSIVVTRAGPVKGGILMTDFAASGEKGGFVPYSGQSGNAGSGQSLDIRPAFATIVVCEKTE